MILACAMEKTGEPGQSIGTLQVFCQGTLPECNLIQVIIYGCTIFERSPRCRKGFVVGKVLGFFSRLAGA